jgi:signal transduction histidine kinase
LKKLGDKKSSAHVLIFIGNIYHSYRRYTKALEYYQESRNIVEKLNWKTGRAAVLHSIASVYADIGKPVLALDYGQKALEICKDMGQKRNIAILLALRGKCHCKLGEYEKALNDISEALDIAKEIKNKDIIRNFYKEIYHIYVAMKSYEQSYDYFKKYKSTNDEIFSKEYQKSISELWLRDKARISGEEILQSIQNNSIQKLKSERQVLARNLIIVLSLLVLVLVLAGVYYLYYRYRIKRKAEQLLKESERKLRAMNSAKDKLFSIIAHDLESPLNGLLLSSGYLEKNYNTMKEKEIKEFIHQIYENTYHMSTLLDNLLQWAVSQLGKLEVDPEILDLSQLTGDTIALMEPSAREKNIRLMSHINENTLAWADKRMVETIMRNLVSNALKYSNKGGEVHISSKSNGNFLEVAVSDTGVGITTDKLETLFAPGIHNSTRGTADESGLGLGLVLCKEFVEKNGGTIRVKNNNSNETSTGTRVVFTLPTHQESRYEEDRRPKPGINETQQ